MWLHLNALAYIAMHVIALHSQPCYWAPLVPRLHDMACIACHALHALHAIHCTTIH